MAFKFTERKNIVKIEIEDKVYPVAVTEKLGKQLMSLEAPSAADFTDTAKVINCIDGYIDSILGCGKAAEIFSGREPDVFERLDVLKYICTELTERVSKMYHV